MSPPSGGSSGDPAGEAPAPRAPPTLRDLRALTQARIALGAHGAGLPTGAALAFGLDHARAREAVWTPLDTRAIRDALSVAGLPAVEVRSNAADRTTYLRRPDQGRTLHPDAASVLDGAGTGYDVALVIADGLSATAVALNAVPLAAAVARRAQTHRWRLAPVVVASQARVAIGDPIGAALKARAVVVLIGERPGLSASDSLGCYITFAPEPGLPDSRRNCLSNIRQDGLAVEAAAGQVETLLRAMIAQGTSGVGLRREAAIPGPAAP